MNEIIMEKNNKVLPILKDYEKERIEFNWENIEKQLFPNGLVNPAYLAIYKDIEKFGNNIGLIWIGKDEVKRFTYNDLAINGSRVANGLRNNGFKSGDRIVLFSRKVPELYFTMIGATLAGGILVPVFQSFGIEALRYRIENSRARFILTHKELLDKVKSAISGLDVKVITIEDNFDEFLGSTDIHIEMKRAYEHWFIIYTSGSTGKPKGIIQSQRTIALYYISGLYHFDLQDDVFWPTGDPGRVAGYASVWTGWLRRVPLISLESKFNAEKWLSIIEEFKVSVWSTAPTALRLLKKN